ncbi:putative cystathionine gamma-lyase 2 [Sitodiplosis mosellana]|uniref:putative cystathionine gamma-lyase 2 n=1 Tax=Sitodiplosis mosellana TaxID=263140 RepID=UPI0024443D7D|nr:putative cystathionine gamma-lyase 2 [Sitodiplosis mosellana]
MSDAGEYTGYETKAIHAGQEYDQWSNREIVPPIVTSMTFFQDDPTNMQGHYYGRYSNPTRDSLERCLAALDNGKHGLVYPSGCAAITALLHLLKQGDHIVSAAEQYGGTRSLFLDYIEIQGIEIDFVDSTDLKQIDDAIKPNTKLMFFETPSNPCLKYSDIAAIAKLVHSQNNGQIVVAVDNTMLTSYFQRPLEFGVDVVMYSLTKYMNGHSDVLAGALVLNDTEIYNKLKIVQTKYGSVLSPFESFLTNRGLKTLPLRMQRHSENGIAVAYYLETQKNVVKVIHPAFPSHPQHELAKKQSSGYCGIVTFQINGGLEESKKFVQNLRLFQSCGSLGSYGSYVMISARVSHVDVPKEVRESIGIFDSTIRLSVGLESADDLIKDLKQAFEKTFA